MAGLGGDWIHKEAVWEQMEVVFIGYACPHSHFRFVAQANGKKKITQLLFVRKLEDSLMLYLRLVVGH